MQGYFLSGISCKEELPGNYAEHMVTLDAANPSAASDSAADNGETVGASS
jgi:hypothetical protein